MNELSKNNVNYVARHLDDCPPGEVSPGEMAPGYLSLWLIVAPVNVPLLQK